VTHFSKKFQHNILTKLVILPTPECWNKSYVDFKHLGANVTMKISAKRCYSKTAAALVANKETEY